MSRKKTESSPGMVSAEKYAKLFLKIPLVTRVILFGRVAMKGDGHDVDLVLELSDPKIGLQFLEGLDDAVQNFLEYQGTSEIPEDFYENLKERRHSIAFSLLELTDENLIQELHNIDFAGRFQEYLGLLHLEKVGQGTFTGFTFQEVEKAREIENLRRPIDLFLMPPNWQTSEEVRKLLPLRKSKRPWSEGGRSFLEIVILQSREFDPKSCHFKPRTQGTSTDEDHLRLSLKRESRRSHILRPPNI